jgi:hypothetical protein
MTHLIDITGLRFGRLVVINKAVSPASISRKITKWYCRCDCGKTVILNGYSLRRGVTRSCGCLRRTANINRCFIHGQIQTSEYWAWANIKSRCYNTNNKEYPIYGGRGIKVCRRWLHFANFYKDMGPRPSSEYSIDRIDPNKGYYPSNCRWATQKTQQNNRRNNKKFSFRGRSMTLGQILERSKSKIKLGTFRARVRKGWSIKRALIW